MAAPPQAHQTALQQQVQPVLVRLAQAVQYLPQGLIHFPACRWVHQAQVWGQQWLWAAVVPFAQAWEPV